MIKYLISFITSSQGSCGTGTVNKQFTVQLESDTKFDLDEFKSKLLELNTISRDTTIYVTGFWIV